MVIGYLLGSIQTAYFVGRFWKHIDIRDYGSHNAGASNVKNVIGWKAGILVAAVDILKAVAAMMAVGYLFNQLGALATDDMAFYYYLTGFSVVLGHSYPFYLKFKGGKGTAPFLGMALFIDWRLGIFCIIALIWITIMTNYIAIGSLGMLPGFVAWTYFFEYSRGCFVIAFLILFLIFWRHIPNLRRIHHDVEKGLRKHG